MRPVERYRPTMDNEVLHSWAKDAQKELDDLRLQVEHLKSSESWQEATNATLATALEGMVLRYTREYGFSSTPIELVKAYAALKLTEPASKQGI